MQYLFPQPPYLLLIVALLASLASGSAFQAVLKQSVKEWSENKSTRSLATMRGLSLFTPFLGMAGGAFFFLSAGVEIFGFPTRLAYAISLPLTIGTAWLVWWQLGKILTQIEEGGSAALDLDSWG
ncbi:MULTISPECIES: hypothetical protein [Leptolyngbya]|uniref:Uncharacterized protein n=2 Tax=Leptolyngbya boryana TaxID=1184 RepID=A0A1Z4JI24_LEPBY|nr:MULTISPECIES: hypothetical protein [Leptolyngbya]BAY56381.1 hypothetical protein NIES2135_32120 [Leptolyngbya boryana NIES-2135]MCY6491887.1 hypothetical protein [Leptolyngbya sp. GGD]ULP27543.1 hypothetical protein MCP04_16010 [Leptolyngbya boryana IU 594]WNZ44700.1 hypothetical protein Q2T42_23185 [Leptolyngbya boryana CZ1]BAS57424.1 hypothetical protein LBWT_33800 [Leptolyngbya boryana IAM M-101]